MTRTTLPVPTYLLSDEHLGELLAHCRETISSIEEPTPELEILIADINLELARRSSPISMVRK